MQFTAVGTLAFADISKPDMSYATSFFSMITQMSMGMGVAVGAIALRIAGFFTGNSAGAPTTKEFHIAFLLVAFSVSSRRWTASSSNQTPATRSAAITSAPSRRKAPPQHREPPPLQKPQGWGTHHPRTQNL